MQITAEVALKLAREWEANWAHGTLILVSEPVSARIGGPDPWYAITSTEADAVSANELDKIETAAWHGRGGKPAEEVTFELDLADGAPCKPAIPGLFAVQSDTRYQGLGFNSLEQT